MKFLQRVFGRLKLSWCQFTVMGILATLVESLMVTLTGHCSRKDLQDNMGRYRCLRVDGDRVRVAVMEIWALMASCRGVELAVGAILKTRKAMQIAAWRAVHGRAKGGHDWALFHGLKLGPVKWPNNTKIIYIKKDE